MLIAHHCLETGILDITSAIATSGEPHLAQEIQIPAGEQPSLILFCQFHKVAIASITNRAPRGR
jgi:hypothetical protein